MKYCVKCGQQLSDETIFCTNCGHTAGNPNPYEQGYSYAPGNPYGQGSPYASNPYGQGSPYATGAPYQTNSSNAIREFSQSASTIRTLGIFAAVLMFGVGFVFSIIIWIKSACTREPMVLPVNEYEQAELESARKKLKIGKILALMPPIALAFCFFLGIILGALGA